ncbi:MAG: hypothetical protein LBH70_07465, partial [Spirochaetaceae bacterium]|nr:hypothetical protein [Spirochaetaceae bacterium]
MLVKRVFFRENLKVALLAALMLCGPRLSVLFPLDLPPREIADDSELRARLFDTWFIETPARVLARAGRIETLPSGVRIEVRTERARGEFGIVLARERNGAFPGWVQGSWVITRSVEYGSLLRIRFFPRSDPYTYIQFRPLDNGRSLLDA